MPGVFMRPVVSRTTALAVFGVAASGVLFMATMSALYAAGSPHVCMHLKDHGERAAAARTAAITAGVYVVAALLAGQQLLVHYRLSPSSARVVHMASPAEVVSPGGPVLKSQPASPLHEALET